MTYDLEHLGRQVDKLSDAIEENTSEKGENSMNDIAGLLALMQGNKGMDLPGLLALCKEKGYDRGWGGEGMFLFVFLILFLFAGNGWNGLNRNQQQDFAAMAGNNCQSIIGLHDRISAAQAVSTNGFTQLQTWLCESIANVTNSIRNQGDRAVDATRNVGDTVRDCCCKLEASLASLNCKVDGDVVDVIKEHVSMEDKPEVCKALDRVKDELKGMLEYKHLDEAYVKKHGSHHYATASFQESMHMFLALDDFFTALIPLLTAEEKAEWSKFRASLPE